MTGTGRAWLLNAARWSRMAPRLAGRFDYWEAGVKWFCPYCPVQLITITGPNKILSLQNMQTIEAHLIGHRIEGFLVALRLLGLNCNT